MQLRDVSPRYSRDRAPDGRLLDAVLSGDGAQADATSRVPLANLAHLIGGQLHIGGILANRVVLSPARNHVADVLLSRARVEMVRAHARPVVAGVANVESVRNRADVEFMGVSVRKQFASTDMNDAVSVRPSDSAGPLPASVGFLDVRPEVVLGGPVEASVMPATSELPPVRAHNDERLSAPLAVANAADLRGLWHRGNIA